MAYYRRMAVSPKEVRVTDEPDKYLMGGIKSRGCSISAAAEVGQGYGPSALES